MKQVELLMCRDANKTSTLNCKFPKCNNDISSSYNPGKVHKIQIGDKLTHYISLTRQHTCSSFHSRLLQQENVTVISWPYLRGVISTPKSAK